MQEAKSVLALQSWEGLCRVPEALGTPHLSHSQFLSRDKVPLVPPWSLEWLRVAASMVFLNRAHSPGGIGIYTNWTVKLDDTCILRYGLSCPSHATPGLPKSQDAALGEGNLQDGVGVFWVDW